MHPTSLLTADDLHYFNEGSHARMFHRFGAHLIERGGQHGANFAVWAPNAERVSVIGEFNDWRAGAHPLWPRDSSGVWEGFVPGVRRGAHYKYHIVSREHGVHLIKADPFAFFAERPPGTASRVWDLAYDWRDQEWMARRRERQRHDRPISIYEIHLGSWRRADDGRRMTYREMAKPLAEYLDWLGFTHVEFMPAMEHPFDGSWGYQCTGYFAPTSRYGEPQDFMALIDTLHQRGIGVILDWVPSHFPMDAHALAQFDGTHLYEHADPRLGFHPDWTSAIFNYGRHEVRSFLLSSAMHWIETFHADALRVDAVASMLYRDYSRREGEWLPNRHGGRENLDAVDFLRQLNATIYASHPDIHMIAEESTAWPGVTRPTDVGGLGFGFKWDMGWMNDTLRYFSHDPVHRKWRHNELTFRSVYAFSENYILPLSHDEVSHGKRSLIAKMPGDDWQKFANLRLLLAFMWLTPAKKLLFMGGEFAQWNEWNVDASLDWGLTAFDRHHAIMDFVRELNAMYRGEPVLHQRDCEPSGFQWIDLHDADQSVIVFVRHSAGGGPPILCAFNFTPVPRDSYRAGAPLPGRWRTVLNSDDARFGGSAYRVPDEHWAEPASWHGHAQSLRLTLPPLAAVALRYEGD